MPDPSREIARLKRAINSWESLLETEEANTAYQRKRAEALEAALDRIAEGRGIPDDVIETGLMFGWCQRIARAALKETNDEQSTAATDQPRHRPE